MLSSLMEEVGEGEDRGFPDSSDGKESACNAGDPLLIPGLGRSPGKRNGYSLRYFCLKNPMDRGVSWMEESMGLQRAGRD